MIRLREKVRDATCERLLASIMSARYRLSRAGVAVENDRLPVVGLTMTLAETVSWYRQRLHSRFGENSAIAKQFDHRLKARPEAAQAEAAVFHFLEVKNLEPRWLEDSGSGGLDFECMFGSDRFAVEVTALGSDTVTERSGFSNDLSPGYAHLSSILSLVRSRVSDKSRQAARYHGPRVLAICSTHVLASSAFEIGAAEFVTGEARIAFAVSNDGEAGEAYMATGLQNSVFLRKRDGAVEAYRAKYSLLLLVALHGDGAHVSGVIHPTPERQLSIDAFRNVPFARMQWPPTDGSLRVEWVIARPRADQHYFIWLDRM